MGGPYSKIVGGVMVLSHEILARVSSRRSKKIDLKIQGYTPIAKTVSTIAYQTSPFHPLTTPPRLPPLLTLSLLSGVRPWWGTMGPVVDACSGRACWVVHLCSFVFGGVLWGFVWSWVCCAFLFGFVSTARFRLSRGPSPSLFLDWP